MALNVLLGEPASGVKVEAPAWLHWRARTVGGKTYIAAVSDDDGEGEGSFTVAGSARVKVVGESRKVKLRGQAFTDTFKKLQMHFYEVSAK